MDDRAAIEGLARLGLTSYEARVFLGLQKLGKGTASEVSEVSDVPRSQVYGAAARLEERGLVETRQSTPTAYRPVSLEQARTRLLDEVKETGDQTFDYLETVSESRSADEQTEAIWLVEGEEAVASRVAELARGAEARILYGTDDPAVLRGQVLDAFRAAAAEGTTVVVGSGNPSVREVVTDEPAVEAYAVPDDRSPDVSVGRVLLVDDRAVLLSVHSTAGHDEGTREVAYWSDGTAFAAVHVELIEEWFMHPFGE